MVEIREVKTAKEKRLFAAFSVDMYRDNPNAAPDLVSDELDNFNPNKNPAYEHCDVVQYLAFKNDECVGRIAGIHNRNANEKWNTRTTRFTRVDFIDDEEVSAALFKAIEKWAASLGSDTLAGPLGFNDLDQEGMLVEGFEYPGPFFTIYNSEYYVNHMSKLGFEKDVDWLEYRITVPEEPSDRVAKLASLVLRKTKLKLIEVQSKREIPPYVKQIFDVLNSAYKDLYGTIELDERLIKKYYDQFIILVNTDYLKLIVDENDKLVAFGLAIPSMNDAVQKSRGRLFPFGWYRVLRAPHKKAETLDLYLVGVLPEYQNQGLPAVLIHAMTLSASKNGLKYAETGPELETNTSVQSLWKYFDTIQHKRRRCWKKSL